MMSLVKCQNFLLLLFACYTSIDACVNYTIPGTFLLGVATSSYQVEGGYNVGGKSFSNQDVYYNNVPNSTPDQTNANIACDSYHLYARDIEMLKTLGANSYRFSISWPRVLPNADLSVINAAGVAYYNNIINLLISNGIVPLVTIHHWDLPESLQQKGGWLWDGMPEMFANYSRFVYEQYGDRVKNWITLNEPLSITDYAYCGKAMPGFLAPGNLSVICPWSRYRAGYLQLLAHAEAYHVYDDEFRSTQNGQVGITLSTSWYLPATPTQADIDAAARARAFDFEYFADPIFFGDYPALVKEFVRNRSLTDGYAESRLVEFTAEEKQRINRTADFLGINYYFGLKVNHENFTSPMADFHYPQQEYDGNFHRTFIPSYPQGLTSILNYTYARYSKPLIVTENGLGLNVHEDSLLDYRRVEYLNEHLAATMAAVYNGAYVFGHTIWSLMDNFEWSNSYTIKYGVYKVNFANVNRTRTLKLSGGWLSDVLRTRNVSDCKPCPDNFKQGAIDPTICYSINEAVDTWINANVICESTAGATLASIDNAFENNHIQGLITKYTNCTQAHIGLRSLFSVWSWVNNDSSSYRNWGSGFPSDPSKTYSTMQASNGKWKNIDDTFMACSVCSVKAN